MNEREIALQIVHDQHPSGPDGATNFDRTLFIMEVFEVTELDLDADYDFPLIAACKDLDTVEACKHLCVLKMSYVKALADREMIDPLACDIQLNFLTLTIQRLNWHLHHLGAGRRTPPFPGLN